MSRLALALVHHPVLDRQGEVVTTAITNLDLHDMSRSSLTYGVNELFVVHPIAAQRELATRIRDHWVTGSGRKRIPDRGTALEVMRISPSLEDVYTELGGRAEIELWTTAANARFGPATSYQEARARLERSERPVLLLFGTGWGLAEDLVRGADLRLAPILGAEGSTYNHLSVRAACAISLDRLRG
jgi:hypothetical protein